MAATHANFCRISVALPSSHCPIIPSSHHPIPFQEGGPAPLIARLLRTLLSSDKFAERRGAAFGLAGAVKGLGLRSMKEHGVLEALVKGLEDK